MKILVHVIFVVLYCIGFFLCYFGYYKEGFFSKFDPLHVVILVAFVIGLYSYSFMDKPFIVTIRDYLNR